MGAATPMYVRSCAGWSELERDPVVRLHGLPVHFTCPAKLISLFAAGIGGTLPV